MATHFDSEDLFSETTHPPAGPGLGLPVDQAGHEWSASGWGERACAICVGNDALERVVFNSEPGSECSICGRDASWAAPVDALFRHVYGCLLSEYEDPNFASLPIDPDTGTYLDMVEIYSTENLMYEIGELFTSDDLTARLEENIDHEWVSKNGVADSQNQRMIASWRSFKQRLKTGPKFLFDQHASTFPEASYVGLEDFVSLVAAHMQQQLVKEVPAGLLLHRARWSTSEAYITADKLGSPPPDMTGSQRLSPAGVLCFYAAEDRETASSEVRPKVNSTVSYGEWRTTQPLVVVDFATEVTVPSLFDPIAGHLGDHYRFVRDFGREISLPTALGHVDANDYLATEIIAEFFRYKLLNAYKQGVDAIRYRSSIHEGGVNWCIFGPADREDTPRVRFCDFSSAVWSPT